MLAHGVDDVYLDGYDSNCDATFYSLTDKNTIFNDFTINEEYLENYVLSNPQGLHHPNWPEEEEYTYKYALVVVTPKESGTYKAGIIEANFDPIMILYDGSFDPLKPGENAVVGSDDTRQDVHRNTLHNKDLNVKIYCFYGAGNIIVLQVDYGPQIEFYGEAGRRYPLLIAGYNPEYNNYVALPLQFYATGDVIIQSWDVETQGTVTPDGTEDLIKFEKPKLAPSFFHGALAELGMEVDRICWGLGHCDELRPRPKAWFFRGFHSHLHRNGADNGGYHGDISGGVVGGDRVRTISQKTLLCAGMQISYANVRLHFWSDGSRIRQFRRNGALFAQMEHHTSHQKIAKLYAAIGAGHSHGKVSRSNVQGDFFSANFDGAQFFAALEVSQELFRCLGWRIGPKLGAEYGWQRQNGYAEDGGSGALRIGNVDHRFFTTALGVGLARTISANGNGKCGHISTTVTWRCQAMRNHSNPTAYKQGSTAELFPIIGYGARSSAAISLAICRHFDRHWSGNLSWSSDFAHGRRDGHASAQLCYEF